jgi:hypothetical protein
VEALGQNLGDYGVKFVRKKRLAVAPKGGDPRANREPLVPLDPAGGRWPVLSVPVWRSPRNGGGRWAVILYALDSWGRTFRLCLILFVAAIAPCLAAVTAALIHHILLRG